MNEDYEKNLMDALGIPENERRPYDKDLYTKYFSYDPLKAIAEQVLKELKCLCNRSEPRHSKH